MAITAEELLNTLKRINASVPFDAKLAGSEFGPWCEYLSTIELDKEENHVKLIFEQGEVLGTAKAICALEPIVAMSPNANAVCIKNESLSQLSHLYHEPPVTILE